MGDSHQCYHLLDIKKEALEYWDKNREIKIYQGNWVCNRCIQKWIGNVILIHVSMGGSPHYGCMVLCKECLPIFREEANGYITDDNLAKTSRWHIIRLLKEALPDVYTLIIQWLVLLADLPPVLPVEWLLS